jgi:serine/threonine protein phosphatase PrpC
MKNDHILIATDPGRRREMEDRVFACVFPTSDMRVPELDLKDLFAAAHNATHDHISGAVVTAAFFHAATNSVTVAQLGDARAYLSIKNDKNLMQSKLLVQCHTPTRPDEKKRILASGGEVDVTGRHIYGDLTLGMSRAFGASHIKTLGHEPEIKSYPLAPELNAPHVIVMSDGFFVTGREKITRYDQSLLKTSWDKNPARHMVEECRRQSFGQDNMACAIMKIIPALNQDALLIVTDGFNGVATADAVIRTARDFVLSRYPQHVEIGECRP